ncbi:hypothetical protein LCL99_12740 [Halomonas denitrificans]|uniref:hypothetical protein n=1 Tax=Halomonas TaxID=2745 RepID=UPI001A8FD26E|nr:MULTISPECIES: hypothetical protein [Halomonas]MBN8412235.1 hypothetical protein [Halomonas litopenaei]MBY5924511.1 hypothetical protein [Halomonas sp. DP4Y7-2]MBY5929778.1 hypothetical protein [Halomonas sp. DP8Y7-3]MBY5968472.1 hypothetical protein [Halomonas denitrificans]MBY5984151.1 hypothetical protein [Halomonas sp. DP5Y7-2]
MNQMIAKGRIQFRCVASAIIATAALAAAGQAQSDNSLTDATQVFATPIEQHIVNDGALDQIRGRFVPDTAIDADGVILWDERPGRGAGGGGGDSSHRVANGLNNRQSATVTTQRDW